ncbi:hypothetical protein Q2T52_11235 [Rhizobium oryzicola]|uniref:Dehydrogenase n=1 Tax=Rhizobium oryzicola TaxID=1232668 RepID=A0ABT8SWC3_9HYPH|nr:hypothetical protein [Rhizobium oryzicola]MDO1582656.1 hypothetical protein [Rhizobium oryzicola]
MQEHDEIEDALASYQGDARATIATLLEDLKFVRSQLELHEGAMSRGLTRGWQPAYERPSMHVSGRVRQAIRF